VERTGPPGSAVTDAWNNVDAKRKAFGDAVKALELQVNEELVA